jgi:ribonuclease-3 family protein
VSERELNLPHPRALAFLGDAVFEILLREMAVAQGLSHSKDLHAFTTQRARAEAQVALLHQIKTHLTDAELETIRQGRNVAVSAGRRAGQSAHRQATGFEALLGALYLTDRERLYELWHRMEPLLASVPKMAAADNTAPDSLLE